MARRVLIVDDDPGVVQLVRANLQAEGLEVTTAANGAECLLAVDSRRPDLIILDVVMPVMDGLQTLRLLKEKPETASIPVIMLTVCRSDVEVLHGWTCGVDLYLTKPFEPSELIALTKSMLEAKEPDEAKETDGKFPDRTQDISSSE